MGLCYITCFSIMNAVYSVANTFLPAVAFSSSETCNKISDLQLNCGYRNEAFEMDKNISFILANIDKSYPL